MKQTITLTFDELDIILDTMLIVKKKYPVSWKRSDEETLEKIKNAWNNAYEEKERS